MYTIWKTKRRRVSGFCTHCGNDGTLTVTLEQPWVERTLMTHGRKTEEGHFLWMLSVSRCKTCNGILVHQRNCGPDSHEKLELHDLVWPQIGGLGYPTPENIRRLYADALTIKERSPDAFVVQIRRALEALCRERGRRGNLSVMLEELKIAGEIPAKLAPVADIIRLTGNAGAHSQDAVTAYQANEVDAFFRAIVEYVYVAPFSVRSFEISRKASTRSKRKRAGAAGSRTGARPPKA